METKKVTMQLLRQMKDGETKKLALPSAVACNNGKATAYQAQHVLGCRFALSTDYSKNVLTVTKNPTV